MLVKLAPYLPNVISTEILDNLKKLIKTFLLCLLELFIFIDFLKSGVSKCVSCFYFFCGVWLLARIQPRQQQHGIPRHPHICEKFYTKVLRNVASVL